jgi:hypothetical protein
MFEEAQQLPQGRMVGRAYIPPNPLEYLAAGLRGIGGLREQDMAAKELQALRGQRTEATNKALADFLRQSQSTPAEMLPEGVEGPTRPAQAPNLRGAYSSLLQSPDAGMRQLGQQGVISMAQAEEKLRQDAAKTQRIGQMLTTMTPQQAIAAGVPAEVVKNYYESRNFGRDKVEFKDVGGQFVPVTPYGDRPQGVEPLEKTGNPFSDLVVRGPDGSMVPNAALVGAKTGIARAGKTDVSVKNFNTQESEQSKVYGKELGDIRATITKAGFEAPKRLAQLDRMDQLLAGIDGGAAAPALADIASAANSLGIKIDPKLGNKQAAEALSIEMALKMRPAGSGPMTDKDFENFLKSVPSLAKTAEGRAQISKTMRAAIQRDLEASKFAREYARQNNGVIDDAFFEQLAQFYAQNPVVTPAMPATNSRGMTFSDPQKENRYQEWLKSQGAQ